jgi:hypothetical protein
MQKLNLPVEDFIQRLDNAITSYDDQIQYTVGYLRKNAIESKAEMIVAKSEALLEVSMQGMHNLWVANDGENGRFRYYKL